MQKQWARLAVAVLAASVLGCGSGTSGPTPVAGATGAIQVQLELTPSRQVGSRTDRFRLLVFTPAPDCRVVRERTFQRLATGPRQLLTVSELPPGAYTVRLELLTSTSVTSIYEETVQVQSGQTVQLVDPEHLDSVAVRAVLQGERQVPLKIRLVPVTDSATRARSGSNPVGDFGSTSTGGVDLNVSSGTYRISVNDTSQNYSYTLQSGSGSVTPSSGSVISGSSGTIQVVPTNFTSSRAFRYR